jgi:hypothetical protein
MTLKFADEPHLIQIFIVKHPKRFFLAAPDYILRGSA